MTSSDIDIKYIAINSEFPFCIRDALSRIEKLCIPQNEGSSLLVLNMEMIRNIMTEYIFCEIGRKSGMEREHKLNYLQELQLLEVLSDYFGHGASNEAFRNALFMMLFPPAHPTRSLLLAKLVSMAISLKNIHILNATGIWMQQLGCTNHSSLSLARSLVKDHFVLAPGTTGGLRELPQVAPHFTANFLTAIAEMYANLGTLGIVIADGNKSWSPPPHNLLETIAQWVSENRALCLAAFLVNLQQALPSGGIPMTPLTPFAGLFKWCVLAPMHYCKQGLTEPADYSRLHLALLESLIDGHNFLPPSATPAGDNVVLAQHLASFTDPIHRWNKELQLSRDTKLVTRGQEALHQAIERLAQVVQVSLVTRSVYGNKQDLLHQLEQLPENRLLMIVLSVHHNKC